MKQMGNVVQIEETINGRVANDPVFNPTLAFRDNRVDVIYRMFPNLSHLERYALATVLEAEHLEHLGDTNYAGHFNQNQIAEGVHQYLSYLGGREKWEIKNMNEKSKPVWFRREREPK